MVGTGVFGDDAETFQFALQGRSSVTGLGGVDRTVEFLSDVKSYFVLFYPFSWDESIDGAPGDSFIRRLVPLLTVRR
jgi:hypothetical protein